MQSSRRRRWLRVAGVVSGVVLLFVVLPGFWTMQPSFFGRYPKLVSKQHPWLTSTHAQVGCQACHEQPGTLAQATYRARLVGEAYVSLVARNRVPGVFDKPSNAACLSCHYDLRTVSPKGDLQIPHKAHVQILKMRCVDCHTFLVHEKSPEGKHTPRMASCLKCHDGDTADNACTACHTEKATPATHKNANWKIMHPIDAAKPDAECVKCHGFTKNWCSWCHARRPASHGPDWRAKHGQVVNEHRNCEACHKAAFCVRCHGELPKLNFDANLKLAQ